MVHALKEIAINFMEIFSIILLWEFTNKYINLIKISERSNLYNSQLCYFCYIGLLTVITILVICVSILHLIINNYFNYVL